MTDFIYSLGDFFYWIFSMLEVLGDAPNWAFIILGFIGMFIWLKMQKDFNNKAKAEGTLK